MLQLKRGSRTAFEQFYNQQYFSVFYFACRFLPDSQAAEDVTTDSFLKLWQRLNDFESMGAMHAFLQITVKNACLNLLRSRQRESARYLELYNLLEQNDPQAFDQQQLTAQLYQHIYEEIEKLSPQLKKVFMLAYIEGLSNEEIALQLDIHNQSVRNDKARALKQLRLALAGNEAYLLFLLSVATHKTLAHNC